MADEKIIFSMVGVSKTFPPHKKVLNNIYLSFFYGAKIGIIGLNGSGKSTLMKIIAGVEKTFEGEVVFSPGYKVGYLEQDPHLDDTKTVKEVVQEGVQDVVDLLKEYEEVNAKFAEPMDDDQMNKLIEDVGTIGKISRKKIAGNDITDIYQDTKIRLENAYKARENYRRLMEKATTVDEMLRVEAELQRVTEKIE